MADVYYPKLTSLRYSCIYPDGAAPRHTTTMSRLPSTRGGALVRPHRQVSDPVGPALTLIFLLLHEQRLPN
jgi:hypothetical protein